MCRDKRNTFHMSMYFRYEKFYNYVLNIVKNGGKAYYINQTNEIIFVKVDFISFTCQAASYTSYVA